MIRKEQLVVGKQLENRTQIKFIWLAPNHEREILFRYLWLNTTAIAIRAIPFAFSSVENWTL